MELLNNFNDRIKGKVCNPEQRKAFETFSKLATGIDITTQQKKKLDELMSEDELFCNAVKDVYFNTVADLETKRIDTPRHEIEKFQHDFFKTANLITKHLR
ncbi:MAG TPA: hypothetical protein DDY13_07250 [Cytophagales bacterium]|jgi:hypothetical protein|nr:hypothetical protein [Cytophagales bacterium]